MEGSATAAKDRSLRGKQERRGLVGAARGIRCRELHLRSALWTRPGSGHPAILYGTRSFPPAEGARGKSCGSSSAPRATRVRFRARERHPAASRRSRWAKARDRTSLVIGRRGSDSRPRRLGRNSWRNTTTSSWSITQTAKGSSCAAFGTPAATNAANRLQGPRARPRLKRCRVAVRGRADTNVVFVIALRPGLRRSAATEARPRDAEPRSPGEEGARSPVICSGSV